eukprot:830944_1
MGKRHSSEKDARLCVIERTDTSKTATLTIFVSGTIRYNEKSELYNGTQYKTQSYVGQLSNHDIKYLIELLFIHPDNYEISCDIKFINYYEASDR